MADDNDDDRNKNKNNTEPTISTTSDGDGDGDIKAHAAVQEMLDLYKYIASAQNYTGFDAEFMTHVRLVSATAAGVVTWELDITDAYANINQVMHGGAAGVIFDMATTASLCPVQREGYWDFLGGVTRSLNVSYLRAVPVGGTVRIVSELVQHGRTMAFLRGRMESVDGAVVYAACEHHKVNVPSLGEHLKLREEMRQKKKRRDGKL